MNNILSHFGLIDEVNTVKVGDKEQIGVKEPFSVTNCQFTSYG